MATTALTVITNAFRILNVFLPGEAIPSAQSNSALTFLNDMINSWAQNQQTIPVVAREVFDLVADQGSPTNPYTIGTGGDFDTDRPPNQNSVVGAALLLTTPSPNVEVPLPVITDNAYQSIQIKALGSSQPTVVYYNPKFTTSELGEIYLWPVPNIATNDLVLYLQKQISEFANLSSTTYQFPPGYEEAMKYQLARRLAGPWGAELLPTDERLAAETFANMQRSNTKMSDLRNDFAFDRRLGYYNIQSGNL